MYYCYILKNNDEKYKNYTYIGCTNNPLQRIRQHNQEISGGAKYTSSKGNLWEIIVLFEGFNNYKDALRCEWRLKHPDNKVKKSSKYSKIHGRFRALNEVLQLERWTSNSNEDNSTFNFKLYIKNEYINLVSNELPKNIEIIEVENIKNRLINNLNIINNN